MEYFINKYKIVTETADAHKKYILSNWNNSWEESKRLKNDIYLILTTTDFYENYTLWAEDNEIIQKT